MKRATKEKEGGNAPIYSKQLGQVKASTFENEKDGKFFFNVQINRRYRSADGEWHDSNVLNGESDVTHLIEILHCVQRDLQKRTTESVDEQ